MNNRLDTGWTAGRYGVKLHLAVLLFALLYPTALTWGYFVALSDLPTSLQQAVYGIGKVFQFSFPVVFVVYVLQARLRWGRPNFRGIVVGLGFGLFVLAAMLLLYHWWLKSSEYFHVLQPQVVQKIEDLGIDSFGKYALVGLFYALMHSFLEEYYWRWFVFGQLRVHLNVPAAIAISSLGFMAHHVVLLTTFLGPNSILAYLMALGVAIGGAVWAWIYSRNGSLIAPWLSHAVVDAAIFLIGFDIWRNVV